MVDSEPFHLRGTDRQPPSVCLLAILYIAILYIAMLYACYTLQALLTLRSDIFALRGQCLHEQHQLRPAIAAYDSAIALQPDHGSEYSYLGCE